LNQLDRPYLDDGPAPALELPALRPARLEPAALTSPLQFGHYCVNPSNLPPPRPRFIPAQEVIAAQPERVTTAVANQYGLSPAELFSRKRGRGMDEARQVAAYLLRELTEMSYAEIGRALGRRDHSTVMLGAARCRRALARDLRLREIVERLARQIVQEAGG
jgi:hypothetical protein